MSRNGRTTMKSTLAQMRVEANLTLKDVEDLTGIPIGTLGGWETGRVRSLESGNGGRSTYEYKINDYCTLFDISREDLDMYLNQAYLLKNSNTTSNVFVLKKPERFGRIHKKNGEIIEVIKPAPAKLEINKENKSENRKERKKMETCINITKDELMQLIKKAGFKTLSDASKFCGVGGNYLSMSIYNGRVNSNVYKKLSDRARELRGIAPETHFDPNAKLEITEKGRAAIAKPETKIVENDHTDLLKRLYGTISYEDFMEIVNITNGIV